MKRYPKPADADKVPEKETDTEGEGELPDPENFSDKILKKMTHEQLDELIKKYEMDVDLELNKVPKVEAIQKEVARLLEQ